jgi:hypothetical protein
MNNGATERWHLGKFGLLSHALSLGVILNCAVMTATNAQAQSVIYYDTKSAQAKKILFIGNSLTFVNQLPLVLAALIFDSNTASDLKLAEVVEGGATLSQLYYNSDAQKTIKSDGPWTDVVLQEQSEHMVIQPDSTSQFAGAFAQVISQAGARPIIYETWCHSDKTYEQAKIKDVLKDIAQQNRALFVPAGEAFALCREQHPEIGLYSDDRHPSLQGTYLAACVFYAKIFNRSPVGLPSDLTLVDQKSHEHLRIMTIDPKMANTLQQIALRASSLN